VPLMAAAVTSRMWQVWLAIAVCAAVLAVDFTVYRPARARMERALQGARSIGLSLDPSQRPILAPAPVQEFMMANSRDWPLRTGWSSQRPSQG
jgi:hypothetical protein